MLGPFPKRDAFATKAECGEDVAVGVAGRI